MGRKREIKELLEKDSAFRALELRKQGWTYEEIAFELGISIVKAQQLVQEQIQKLEVAISDRATELREVILQRIEVAIDAIYPDIVDGKVEAIDRMIKLNDQAAMLLGVKVSRHDLTSGGETIAGSERLAVLAKQAQDELDDWRSDGESVDTEE